MTEPDQWDKVPAPEEEKAIVVEMILLALKTMKTVAGPGVPGMVLQQAEVVGLVEAGDLEDVKMIVFSL